MNLGEIAHCLDERFNVQRFIELANWDFALSPRARESLISRGSATFRSTFNGLLNGEGERHIDRAYLVVFPEASLLDQIVALEVARGRLGALILTHHPCDMETSGRGFMPIADEQLDRMRDANIALFVLHAPLDCHAEISTSGALADGLGLRRTSVFAPYVGGYAGIIGEQEPEPFAAFADRVRRVCELPYFMPNQVRFNGRMVSKVAILAGGGDDIGELKAAQLLGADMFLAGHWWTPHIGEWADRNRAAIAELLPKLSMNLLSGSHDGSELVVFRDRLVPLIEELGLDVHLIRQADHWR
ncbi:MAG: Nif3-like dinuclear metal center hexameric protein [Thermomicrobiales bacterium]